ncbi:MAG: nucleoside triphosphate pyrophosphohydrolase [Gammaproteobacteria bacterium]
MSELFRLRALMRQLRDPHGGCPWDLRQTYQSIVPHTLEEAYEVAQAIEESDFAALPGELGDLLFQVIFYCQLAEEEARFSLDDVIEALETKLRERHPHVFGADAAGSTGGHDAERVARDWEARKAAQRRAERGAESSELDDVPLLLPALSRAAKIQRRAARVGFDWPDAAGARAKLDEELMELDDAGASDDQERVVDEFGDVLFSMVNIARHLGIEPEGALRRATAKFEQRFRRVEELTRDRHGALGNASPAALDELWELAKAERDPKV